MSTAYGGYPASQAIDGNINTMAVTQVGMNNWLSIRLSESTDVRYVGVVNRQDQYASLLGCFEIYLGRFMFNELAVQCGGVQCYDASKPALEHYFTDCGGISASYITMRQVHPDGAAAVPSASLSFNATHTGHPHRRRHCRRRRHLHHPARRRCHPRQHRCLCRCRHQCRRRLLPPPSPVSPVPAGSVVVTVPVVAVEPVAAGTVSDYRRAQEFDQQACNAGIRTY